MSTSDQALGPRVDRGASREALPRKRKAVRVLFINDTSRNGGPGSTLLFVLKFMDAGAVYRTVVVPRSGLVADRLRAVSDELRFEPNLIENIFEPWSRAIERQDFNAPFALRAIRALGNVGRAAYGMSRMAALVKYGKYDAIFCNGTTANFAGAALGAVAHVPVIWHVFYTHVAASLDALHARLAASDAVRAILCVSRPTARLFDESAPSKVRIVHDSIDTLEFSDGPRALRRELRLSDETVIFGSHGRILPRKGYLEMIRAARLALDDLSAHERDRCRFVVLGDTPQDTAVDHLTECRALVKEIGLERHVLLIGFRQDVKPYVRDFDVAVVPSVYEDPLPRALFEAMAFRKPVVAFSVGGIPELVEDGVHGSLAAGNPPNVPQMAAYFVRYFRSAELRRLHGEAGRRRLELEFDARPHARKIQWEIEHAVDDGMRFRSRA
jgi:glycosyltransferase involved in cell wall biosynthesis